MILKQKWDLKINDQAMLGKRSALQLAAENGHVNVLGDSEGTGAGSW